MDFIQTGSHKDGLVPQIFLNKNQQIFMVFKIDL